MALKLSDASQDSNHHNAMSLLKKTATSTATTTASSSSAQLPRSLWTSNDSALTETEHIDHPQSPSSFATVSGNAIGSAFTSTMKGVSNDGSRQSHRQSAFFSPPLTSTYPPSPGSFSVSNSPLQERCEALESELSELRNRFQRSEQHLTVREKRLSQAQQKSHNTEQSLRTLKQQHEMTLIRLSKVQAEATQSRTLLEEKHKEIQELKTQVQHQARDLKEAVMERDSLSLEMVDCHADNAKFLRRLRTSNDKTDQLQDENRHLIEQLRELRARIVEILDERAKLSDTLGRERYRAGQAALELERVVARYRDEVERLQDLVLAMGHKHVQVQRQLAFLQQQAQAQMQMGQKQQLAIEHPDSQGQEQAQALVHRPSSASSALYSPSTHSSVTGGASSHSTSALSSHGGLVLGDGALASILSSVAASSHSRRSKPTRRFTMNALPKEAPQTLEQRKCELLMDQITVLQRGHDNLRQEKITLELQLDLMQRQHGFQQQQRERRRGPQRKALVTGTESSKGLLSSNTVVEQCAQVDEATEKNRQAKDLQIQGALASLEPKRDSPNVNISSRGKLKYLDRLRLPHETQQQVLQQAESSGSSSSASTPSPLLSSSASPAAQSKSLKHYTQER
ncbi:hypothetical protein BGZ54_006682, partial [Gamsiella multidivaricata]